MAHEGIRRCKWEIILDGGSSEVGQAIANTASVLRTKSTCSTFALVLQAYSGSLTRSCLRQQPRKSARSLLLTNGKLWRALLLPPALKFNTFQEEACKLQGLGRHVFTQGTTRG